MEKQMAAQKTSAELEAQIGERVRSTFQPLAASAEHPENVLTETKVKRG